MSDQPLTNMAQRLASAARASRETYRELAVDAMKKQAQQIIDLEADNARLRAKCNRLITTLYGFGTDWNWEALGLQDADLDYEPDPEGDE